MEKFKKDIRKEVNIANPNIIEKYIGDNSEYKAVLEKREIIKDVNFDESESGLIKSIIKEAINLPNFSLYDENGNKITGKEYDIIREKYVKGDSDQFTDDINIGLRYNTFTRMKNQIDSIFNMLRDFGLGKEKLDKWKEDFEIIKNQEFSDEQVGKIDNLLIEIYNNI